MNGPEEPDGEALSAQEERELKDSLRPPWPARKGSQCPDEERLRLVVAGLAAESEARELLAHAATCVPCGTVLREAAEDFDSPPTEEELAVAANCRLASAENQRAFAERLAGSARARPTPVPIPAPKPVLKWKLWGAAAAMAAAIGAAGIFLWPASPERLLARAYTEYRPMEMRLPGAAYGPVRTERRDRGELPILGSADLHEAEARILREVETHPDDPEWLHLQGRVHLLTEKPDEAIAVLERAHALQPKDAYILSDLGAAWFQKAQRAGKVGDLKSYSSAYEYLSQGARLKPADPALVFNRALAAEHIFAFNEARDGWDAYLRLDSKSPWAKEARTHLEEVKKKLDRQQADLSATAPDTLIANLRRGAAGGGTAVPDEQYLNVAVTRLLPEYYSDAPDNGTGRALRALARALVIRHGDPWLQDVLTTPRTRTAADAFAALGKASEAGQAADTVASGELARTAGMLFRSASSKPGALRARLEQVFALQMRSRYAECASVSKPLREAVRRSNYPWIYAQALLEEGVCELWDHNFERGGACFDEALRVADAAHYGLLGLRVLGLQAIRQQVFVGSTAKAWGANALGLSIYWTGSYPFGRAQDLYSTVVLLAAGSKIPQAAVAWARELAELASMAKRPDIYAAAIYQLGTAETAAGLDDDAVRHLRRSASLASTLYSKEDQEGLAVRTEMAIAAIESKHGRTEKALSRLLAVQHQTERCDPIVQLMFATQSGELRLKRGEYAEAGRLLQGAQTFAERNWIRAVESERVTWTRGLGDVYRALVECELRTAGERRSWERWAQYRAALFDRRSSLESDWDTVLAGEAILSFAELPSGMVAWLARPRGLLFRRLPQETTVVADATGRLARECANERSSESLLRADARQLSNWLLGSWDKELDGVRTVVVETDGSVAALPWPALVRSNGHYWSEDFALRTRVAAGRRPLPVAPLASLHEVLAVGASALNGADALPELPDAKAEAEKVSSLFRRSLFLTGDRATLTEVRNRLSSAELFHFAGHGYGGEGGGLWLSGGAAQGALLRATDIRNLNLSSCRLVVLSGCSTGSGELKGPGDPDSLVRAFLRAGSREVVAGVWNLNSPGTAVFMQNFYQSMLMGASAAESLRQASAAARSSRTYAHPYYWAGLQVFSSE